MRLWPSVLPSRRREAMDGPGATQTDRNIHHRLVRAGNDQTRGGQEDRPTSQQEDGEVPTREIAVITIAHRPVASKARQSINTEARPTPVDDQKAVFIWAPREMRAPVVDLMVLEEAKQATEDPKG
ncbi:hypothetical protein U1Q18_038532 [Sarracenia purpurea var. burkii]